MPVAYFIRGGGESWAVIELHPDNREKVVAAGLSLKEAEAICMSKLEEIVRAAPVDSALTPEDIAPQRPRQFAFKF